MRYRAFWQRLASVACTVLLLAACGAPATGSTASTPLETPPAATAEPPAATGLEDTVWQLVEYGPADAPVAPSAEMTATFESGGKLNGSSGCNSYFATYTLDGQTFSASEVGSTEMACLDDNLMRQEAAYLAALVSATALRRTGDELMIDYDGGVLRFARQAPATAPLEGTTWQLTSFVTGDTATSTVDGATVTAVFADGRITGSAGCNQYGAGYTLDGEALAIEPVVTTKIACDPAMMTQEQTFVNALGAANNLAIVGAELRLAYDGGLLVFSAGDAARTS